MLNGSISSLPSAATILAPINLSVSLLRISPVNPLMSRAAIYLRASFNSNYETSKGMFCAAAYALPDPAPATRESVHPTRGSDE